MTASYFDKKIVFILLILVIPLSSFGQTDNPWNILCDAQGKIASMSLSGMRTNLNIEKEIKIDIDQDGNPIRGKVKFVNETEREMTQREAIFYWEQLNGPHAFWEYLASKDKIVSITPKNSALPLTAFGRQSRVITDEGKEYVGKINAIPSNQEWFTIEITGSMLNVYKQVVRVIQQMK